MYLPAQFAETRPEVMHELMRTHAFATLVTLGADGLNANHLPFEFDPEAGPFGTLRAHAARGNPVWRDLADGIEALVVFQGPQAYVSPGWYATKKEDGRVVPTYNYAVVHAYGPLRAIQDKAELRGILTQLTARHESAMAPMAQPWKLEDAPEEYSNKLLEAIVGIEIPVSRLIGKWKVSQNQPQANRIGVEQGLRALGGEQAAAMADVVARYSGS
jgi:transcriptional regulator